MRLVLSSPAMPRFLGKSFGHGLWWPMTVKKRWERYYGTPCMFILELNERIVRMKPVCQVPTHRHGTVCVPLLRSKYLPGNMVPGYLRSEREQKRWCVAAGNRDTHRKVIKGGRLITRRPRVNNPTQTHGRGIVLLILSPVHKYIGLCLKGSVHDILLKRRFKIIHMTANLQIISQGQVTDRYVTCVTSHIFQNISNAFPGWRASKWYPYWLWCMPHATTLFIGYVMTSLLTSVTCFPIRVTKKPSCYDFGNVLDDFQ